MPRKGGKNRPLTDADRRYNAQVGRNRIQAEHVINRIKQGRYVEDATRDTIGEFDMVFSIAVGLANFGLMFRETKAGRGVACRVMESARRARERGIRDWKGTMQSRLIRMSAHDLLHSSGSLHDDQRETSIALDLGRNAAHLELIMHKLYL